MLDIKNVFKPEAEKGEIISKKELRIELGIPENDGSNLEEEQVQQLYDVFNQIGVVHKWNEKGDYVGAEIPTDYFAVLRNYARGHKRGESSALY